MLVLADMGILGFAGPEPAEEDNLVFLRNLARYARALSTGTLPANP